MLLLHSSACFVGLLVGQVHPSCHYRPREMTVLEKRACGQPPRPGRSERVVPGEAANLQTMPRPNGCSQ